MYIGDYIDNRSELLLLTFVSSAHDRAHASTQFGQKGWLGADRMIRRGGGGYNFFCPEQTLSFFFLLLPRNKLFLSGKGKTNFPPYNPIFCQFCEKPFVFTV